MTKPLVQSTGRRKEAVARARLRNGEGKITINGREVEDFFPNPTHRMILSEPLRLTETEETYDVDATLHGGGVSGQAGALRLAIARALIELDPELRTPLKRAGFLTRDDRKKESKKYGLKKARKSFSNRYRPLACAPHYGAGATPAARPGPDVRVPSWTRPVPQSGGWMPPRLHTSRFPHVVEVRYRRRPGRGQRRAHAGIGLVARAVGGSRAGR